LTRFGNEAFEYVRPGEITAVEHVYDSAAPGTTLMALNSNIPWRFKDLTAYRYETSENLTGSDVVKRQVAEFLRAKPGSRLLVTTGQIEYGIANLGYPADYRRRLQQAFRGTPVVLSYSNRDADVYSLRPAAGG
jgi:hypothetical protein